MTMIKQTDLAHQNPFTIALKNFGVKTLKEDKGNSYLQIVNMGPVLIRLYELLHYLSNGIISKFADINVEIYRDGKLLTPLQLEKDYQDWLLHMHDHYDEEINFGADQPTFIISPKNKKSLGISSEGRL